ncbi:hypothetical protein QQF64_007716 [Cirrhinus molitorella]|uniref:Homeobox protein EMX1 n=1 Tax=Cirrhinus molitorella TaxID=172907 RepID=A0ABR3MDR1_9TELE
MFQHNKKCFTIESLVGKDSNSSSAAADEPIRPTALRFTESIHPSPFGSCFQNSGRTLYSSSPEMMFTDPATHSTNSGLSLRHLQIPTQPFFSPHQRETLNFYPWVLRNRYLGHRFQGKEQAEDVCSVSAVLEGIAQVIGGSQRLLSLLLRSGVQIEPLCLHTEPIHSLTVSNNLENYCLDKTKCSRGDWVGKESVSANVSMGFNSNAS